MFSGFAEPFATGRARPFYLLPLLLSLLSIAAAVAQDDTQWHILQDSADIQGFPRVFQQKPPLSPSYMVDNERNTHGVAPIQGELLLTHWGNPIYTGQKSDLHIP